MKSTTTINIPTELKKKAKSQGINFSKLMEEALAKELDSGKHIERMKEKIQYHERAITVLKEQIKDCQILLDEKKKPKKEKQKKLPNTNMDAAVRLLMHNIKITNKLPRETVEIQADAHNIDPEELEVNVRKKCMDENITIFE